MRNSDVQFDISQLHAPTKRARLNALTAVLPNRNVKVLPHSSRGITQFQVLFSLIPRPDREPRMHLAVSPPITVGSIIQRGKRVLLPAAKE